VIRHAARQLPSWLIFDVRSFRSYDAADIFGSSKGPNHRESAVSEVRAPMLPEDLSGSTRGPDKVSPLLGLAHLFSSHRDLRSLVLPGPTS
jgi:hypothetical protein